MLPDSDEDYFTAFLQTYLAIRKNQELRIRPLKNSNRCGPHRPADLLLAAFWRGRRGKFGLLYITCPGAHIA
jgi:hypothetical protein